MCVPLAAFWFWSAGAAALGARTVGGGGDIGGGGGGDVGGAGVGDGVGTGALLAGTDALRAVGAVSSSLPQSESLMRLTSVACSGIGALYGFHINI